MTKRERQILQLSANGASCKEIAARLFISPRTVEHHLESVRIKLDTKNNAHSVYKAMLNGIIS